MNVYDFDNTIYDGESGFDIFMFYLKKDPKEIAKLIPRFGEAFIRYKRGAIKTDEVIEQYGDMLTDYCVNPLHVIWLKRRKSFLDNIHMNAFLL